MPIQGSWELKKFLDAKKTETRLMGDVERHLMRRPESDRRTDVLHPSEMIKADWCHRYSFYLLKGGKKKQEKPSLRLQNIFDEGHAIHEKWQSRFHEMGYLYGKFKCLHCGNVMSNVISPSQCDDLDCGSMAVKYDEVSLKDETLKIAGHTDGWIKGLGEDCLIEIKSIGAGTIRYEAPELLMDANHDLTKAWKNIRRPFHSHLLQGQMYLELAKRMYGDEAPNEIVFIYELKADQDYKEFTVKANFEIVERVFNAAKKVVDAVEAAKMPECNVSKDGCKQCDLIP
jgi:hypothetical protein